MKPTNIPEKEFLTPEGYRLHRAEMMAAAARRAKIRKVLLWLALAATLILATCANAEPITERTANVSEAFKRAGEIAKASPYKLVRIRVVPGTYSMYPTLDHGCVIVEVRKPWAEASRNGEISGFMRYGKGFVTDAFVLHRVRDGFSKKGVRTSVILRGDNNTWSDSGTFNADNYDATVYAIIRFKDVPYHASMSVAVWKATLARETNASK